VKPVEFHPEAEAELDEAVAYYEAGRKGVGLRLQAEVEQAVAVIQSDPERHAFQPRLGCRKVCLKRFPYNVYYLELADRIRIVAVAHHKRRLGYWTGRSWE
jgi:toxin ParE1/3/4